MLTSATARYLRVSPRKVRRLLRLIQGLGVPRAQAVLGQILAGAGRHVRRVLKSAVASAAQKGHPGTDDLFVAKAVADEGPMWKRQRAAAMGRGVTIRKRTCHLRIELDVGKGKIARGR